MHHRLVPLIAAAVLASGCAKKDSAPAQDSSKVAQAGASAKQSSFDPTTRTAVVHAHDYAFDAPDTLTSGLTHFHFVNDGPNFHHMQIVRLDSGKTVTEMMDALKDPKAPPPHWLVFMGGPNAPSPGGSSDAYVPLTPGNYAVICLVDLPDHVPHFMKGMVHALTVTPAPANAPTIAAPIPDVKVTLADYAFTVDGALTAGTHTVQVTNKGPQPHELELLRFAPGKSVKDFAAWVAAPQGPPPGDGIGGIVAIMPGGPAEYATLTLTPGNYAFICLLPDGAGKTHADHGMVKPFTVQ